jgi:hypothetical protein
MLGLMMSRAFYHCANGVRPLCKENFNVYLDVIHCLKVYLAIRQKLCFWAV